MLQLTVYDKIFDKKKQTERRLITYVIIVQRCKWLPVDVHTRIRRYRIVNTALKCEVDLRCDTAYRMLLTFARIVVDVLSVVNYGCV